MYRTSSRNPSHLGSPKGWCQMPEPWVQLILSVVSLAHCLFPSLPLSFAPLLAPIQWPAAQERDCGNKRLVSGLVHASSSWCSSTPGLLAATTSLVNSPPATENWARPRISSQSMRWALQPFPGCPGSPSQRAQSVAPFLCFPPSLLSSLLRYLILGRNVRRRSMSTREL